MIRVYLAELFSHHSQRCSMFLEAALEMEQTPATQNTHYLQASKEKWLVKYKAARPTIATTPEVFGTASICEHDRIDCQNRSRILIQLQWE